MTNDELLDALCKLVAPNGEPPWEMAQKMAKDAERYRFLRDKASPSDVETWWWGYLGIADPVPAATFDRLIDSAMQSESQPQARDGKETT